MTAAISSALRAALVRHRIREAIDLPALPALGPVVDDAIDSSLDADGAAVGAPAMLDETWCHVEDQWRRFRLLQADDCSCPLCPSGDAVLDRHQPDAAMSTASRRRSRRRARRP